MSAAAACTSRWAARHVTSADPLQLLPSPAQYQPCEHPNCCDAGQADACEQPHPGRAAGRLSKLGFPRRLALPREVKHWSLTTLREKLIKIGAKVIRHAGYVVFQMAEVAVPRALFGKILERIGRLRLAPG